MRTQRTGVPCCRSFIRCTWCVVVRKSSARRTGVLSARTDQPYSEDGVRRCGAVVRCSDWLVFMAVSRTLLSCEQWRK